MRIYELIFVVDPRVSDDDVVQLTDDVKSLLEAGGASIARQESWGRRKLAYPINKLNEGKYMLLYVTVEEGGGNPLAELELRLKQNDKVLRYLTVRTDRPQDIEAAEAEDEGDEQATGTEG
ncbi:MAG: 30S ribosomal protein S6 [Acidobacteriota bacterium]|nr:30S ribosomal protein S6 [Acidobacteriota bacterium]